MGESCEVLLARSRASGALAAMGCRAETRAFLNGEERALGYIGQIRVAPEFRGQWLVSQGAEYFRAASPPELVYSGVIASENPRARQYLARRDGYLTLRSGAVG
jgi:hypothetical protein